MPRRRAGGSGVLLAVACAAEFMVVLDASVVNVALPAVQRGLGFDPATLSWVVNAYALVFAGCLLLGGRVSDLYGTRVTFLGGLAVFVAASAAGGLAVSPAMLVAARAAQALGAAVLAPASLTVLTTGFPEGPRRTRALSAWTALASAGGAAGSLLGGVLSQYLTWRATLLVNLPLGVVAAVAAVRVLPARSLTRPRPALDLPGALSVTVGTAALTYALTAAPRQGWTGPPTLVATGLAAVSLATFVAVEARWSPAPLLPLRLLRLRGVAAGNLAVLLAGACLMPMWYFLSLYLQHGLGLSPLLAGLGFVPHTLITVAVGARVAPRLMERFPARTLVVAGCLINAAGFAWQALVDPADTYLSGVLGPAVLISVGGGLLNTPLTSLVTSGVDPGAAGAASGLFNTAKQLGGALGLACLVAVTTTGRTAAPGREPAAVAASTGRGFAVMAAVLLLVALTSALLPRARAPG